jgi:hypothetical protein
MSDKSNIYAILYDRDLTDTEALHRFIANSGMIERWWHYIKSCYLVKSTHTANQIADAIPDSIRDAGFLVVEIKIENSSGWLTDKAWEWIDKRVREFSE